MQSLKVLTVGTLLCGSLLSAHAQLTLALTGQSSPNVTAGGSVTFSGNLNYIGTNIQSFSASAFTGLFGDFSDALINPSSIITSLNNTGTFSGNLFSLTLSNSPSQTIPTTYNGTVTVNYTRTDSSTGSSSPSIPGANSFTVNSQTPTPPVVLVTLMSGIGTVRLALSRRKKAS